MMKRLMITLIALALFALPSFAAEVPDPETKGNPDQPMLHQHPGMKRDMMHQHPGMQKDKKDMMHQHPGMMKEMMHNPQHMLAMGYHKNLMKFGHILKKVAEQGETVPRDFARAAITEMRRSEAQMEIYREEALGSMPADMKAKQADMAKMMGAHLTEMRTHLGHLEALAKNDRIDSKEVLKHLELLFKESEMCGEGMHGKGMHGGAAAMHGKGMYCRDMRGDCQNCQHCGQMRGNCQHCGQMRHGGMGNWQEMAQQREKMVAEMKAQDAELFKLVDQMNKAPKDQKQGLMAAIVTRLVKQRAALNAHMEKMQEHMKQHMEGASMSPSMSMEGMDSDDMDDEDMDADDTNPDMNMQDMNMQDAR
jgi:hypothetical protein